MSRESGSPLPGPFGESLDAPADPRPEGVSRRHLLSKGGAALAAGLAFPGLAEGSERKEDPEPDASLDRPNLVLLITDQERYPRSWPEGWAEKHLPNRQRLARHGLTFTRAFCNAAMCSPSRATLFTGLYTATNKVKETLQTGSPETLPAGSKDPTLQHTLQPGMQNIAKMLASVGYDVQYRGKWHVSKDPTGTLDVQSPKDLSQYGFQGWLPPDSGTDQGYTHFGGGDTDFDAQYAEQAADFLRNADPRSRRPFALVIALVNPHDVMSYPGTWNHKSYSDIPPYKGSDNYGKVDPDCFRQGISLPETLGEEAAASGKPLCQPNSTAMWASGLGPLDTEELRLNYVNFYAYLHKESDRHIGTIVDALEENRGLWNRTIVFRMADHGEMGLAHGGMRQKAYNAYEETIHVPLVISNPRLFPQSATTGAMASLIDLMPTLATLAGVPRGARWQFQGRDLTPVIQDAVDHPRNPTAKVQQSILFTTDETLGSAMVVPPNKIRCLREADWKIVLTFDDAGVAPSQWELYDLVNDPLERYNAAVPGPHQNLQKFGEMRAKLEKRMAETGTAPA